MTIRTRATLVGLALALPTALGLGFSGVPAEAAAQTGRTEVPVGDPGRDPDIAVSLVSIDAPLPASAGPRPQACDRLSYLRFRTTSGPGTAADADRILLAQPGAIAGAGSFDAVARNTLTNALAAGEHWEFWALDRRSNCLEDPTGIVGAQEAGNPQVALDYYYGGATVDGRTFAGFGKDSDRTWLAAMGMQQTVLDEYTVITTELAPEVRREKLWCGGHSLGGPITAFLAMSDFDGDRSTLDDAGYNQCAGFFALDSVIATQFPGEMLPADSSVQGLVALGKDATYALIDAGVVPRATDFPVINPETLASLTISGVFTDLAPEQRSTLAGFFADNANVELALRAFISKDLGQFLTGTPALGEYNTTNEAALGALMDDNSQPVPIFHTSVGFVTGGRLVDKDFPAPNDIRRVPQLRGLTQTVFGGTENKASPDDAGPIWARGTGPLYTWLNYDEIAGADIPVAADGEPFTTPGKEVTDIGDLADSFADYPVDFTEHYFPTKLLADALLYLAGERSVVPNAVYMDGPSRRPTVTLLGGDGLINGVYEGELPENTLIADGYQHLDVLTAARVQNDGGEEPVARTLTDFVLDNG